MSLACVANAGDIRGFGAAKPSIADRNEKPLGERPHSRRLNQEPDENDNRLAASAIFSGRRAEWSAASVSTTIAIA
jgi:hypothetical protein